jgi:hypothetical protein
LLRTEVSEERIASIIMAKITGMLVTILFTLTMEAIRSSTRLLLQEQHGVTFHKTFIVTAVKTSNLNSIDRLGSVAET